MNPPYLQFSIFKANLTDGQNQLSLMTTTAFLSEHAIPYQLHVGEDGQDYILMSIENESIVKKLCVDFRIDRYLSIDSAGYAKIKEVNP